MTGKIIGAVIVLTALVGGVALYWLQVYGFYDTVEASGAKDDVQLTLLVTGEPEPILYENFKAIDADSSPLRFRACFETDIDHATLTETYVVMDHAVPLTGPSWFDCYDAEAIGSALENETAIAYLGQANIVDGIDRVIAILDDGTGFAWHQLNEKYQD